MVKQSACAKINLFLDISCLRDDGYHDIVSYMQTVSLCDEVTLERADEITVEGNPAVLPEKDLTYRAAKAFFEHTGIHGGVKITLKKNIPMQGGLGGGSADAAAVLRGLNELYSTGLGDDELRSIGGALGSDIPFCVSGGSMLAYGRGERLCKAPNLPDCGIVIAAGGHGCSTPVQFAELDRLHGNFHRYTPHTDMLDRLCNAAAAHNIIGVCESLFNIFEQTDGYDPEIAHTIKATGATGVLMSGSGSSIFGIYESEDAASKAAAELISKGIKAYACRPI